MDQHDPQPTLRAKIRAEMDAKLERQQVWTGILREAIALARAAGEQATPTPMIVYTPQNVGASILGRPDGGPDLTKPVYHVPDGPCGFAWVELYPHDTDTRRFVNWLVGKQAPARADCDPTPILETLESHASKKYGTGFQIWIGAFNQSMQRKECAAQALARTLREQVPGLKAYSCSRMD